MPTYLFFNAWLGRLYSGLMLGYDKDEYDEFFGIVTEKQEGKEQENFNLLLGEVNERF